MTIQEEFYSRIDNDNGYDNQKLGDELIKIAEKHHKKQLSLCSVTQQSKLLRDYSEYLDTYRISLYGKDRTEVAEKWLSRNSG